VLCVKVMSWQLPERRRKPQASLDESIPQPRLKPLTSQVCVRNEICSMVMTANASFITKHFSEVLLLTIVYEAHFQSIKYPS